MKRIVLAAIILFMGSVAYVQTTIPKAQTLFIFNFSRLIEWPASYKTGPFIIGVLGASEVASELEAYTKGKKVGTQEISIMRYKTPQEIGMCHILFVPFPKTKSIAEILSILNNKSTLIITEKDGALDQGSAINFVVIEDKMKFELKPENASKFGIKFSSKLQEMAMQSM